MARSRRTVVYFAKRAGIPPAEALARLVAAGVRLTKESDVLPKNKVHKSEIVLGLARKPQPPPVNKQEVRRELRRTRHAAQHAAQREKMALQREARRVEPRRHDLIGKNQDLCFLNMTDIKRIHWALVDDFSATRDPIAPAGVKDEGLLASALSRCQTCHGNDDKYPTAPMAAAALMHSLIHNHPFHNGNKRTALVGMLVFLDQNGWTLVVEEDPLFEFLMKVGGHQLVDRSVVPTSEFSDGEVRAIALWLASYIKRTRHPHKHLKFQELRSILQSYGCTLDPGHSGSKMNIQRGERHTQVAYFGKGRDVDVNAISKIRRDLELDEVHGYDTDIFYSAEKKLPEFITKYRQTLKRLAKM